MSEEKRIRLAITQGDPNGVGFEIIYKAFEDPTMLELCTPIIYGSPKVASYYQKALESEVHYTLINDASEAKDGQLNFLGVVQEEVKIEVGQFAAEANESAVKALAKAVADVRDGLVDALVAGPVNEQGFSFKDLHFRNQTELVAQLLERHARKMGQTEGQEGVPIVRPLRILTDENLRVAVLTDGTELRDVASKLSQETLAETIKRLHESLRRDFDINIPRIAVLALNADGGMDRQPGEEERNILAPAVEQVATKGMQAFGPYSAETLLTPEQIIHFDAVLAMHRDQVLAPFRLLAQGDGVVLSSGLSVVMTEPGHGACYAIAGKKQADPSALRNAIYLATDVARHRVHYDEPLANPLPKLYHERRDESEKVRFRSGDRREGDKREQTREAQQPTETEEVEN